MLIPLIRENLSCSLSWHHSASVYKYFLFSRLNCLKLLCIITWRPTAYWNRTNFHKFTDVILAMERSRNFVVGVMNKLVSAVDKYSWINNVVHTRKACHQLAPNGTTTAEINRNKDIIVIWLRRSISDFWGARSENLWLSLSTKTCCTIA